MANVSMKEELNAGKRRKRRWWVRPSLPRGDLHVVSNIFQLNEDQFTFLLSRVAPQISKKRTHLREPISAKQKLEITLWLLSSGDTYNVLSSRFQVAPSTIAQFIPTVCDAIYNALKEFFQVPLTEQAWRKIQMGFEQKWNFPDVCGIIDGRHVEILAPKNSGSDYLNYKKKHSIVLMALVTHDYKFSIIDVGEKGNFIEYSEGGIHENSSFFSNIEENKFKIPSDGIFIADNIFPLTSYIMKSYEKENLTLKEQIFNDRLSTVKRISENAFGILANRFQIFGKPILLSPEKVIEVVFAACSLHNWLCSQSAPNYLKDDFTDNKETDRGVVIPGKWRNECGNGGLLEIKGSPEDNNVPLVATQIRDKYCKLFSGPGLQEQFHDKCV